MRGQVAGPAACTPVEPSSTHGGHGIIPCKTSKAGCLCAVIHLHISIRGLLGKWSAFSTVDFIRTSPERWAITCSGLGEDGRTMLPPPASCSGCSWVPLLLVIVCSANRLPRWFSQRTKERLVRFCQSQRFPLAA
jgi:hypothetical protein